MSYIPDLDHGSELPLLFSNAFMTGASVKPNKCTYASIYIFVKKANNDTQLIQKCLLLNDPNEKGAQKVLLSNKKDPTRWGGCGYTFFWKGKAEQEDTRIHGVGLDIRTSQLSH
ncbi:hypothetical protein CHS0354_011825 [Potamilus streckersoni]|uniref:Uncharacterized protein n=1 Tax=Potamilus streckersoni TaxID=2493646 RepID=A0AAE0TGL7_9BIVA|nr:hypothetical protein CHS0354_011825 [Potamilus streckersoni]